MPNQQRDDAQYDYVEDLSFARIFLGMGPKTVRTRKRVGARAGMAAEAKRPGVVVLPVPPSIAATASVKASASEPTAAAGALITDAWTDVQDALLLGLKALGKTWREIGAQVVGKATEDLRERYAVLTGGKEGEKKMEAVVKGVEKTGDETGEKKKDKWEKKKTIKKNNDQEEASDPEVKGAKLTENKSATPLSAILNPHQGPKQSAEAALGQQDDDGQPKFIRGHPIIYVNLDDDLSASDLQYLGNMHAGLDHEKWFQLSSRLRDKTGKEVSADVLKKKLMNLFL